MLDISEIVSDSDISPMTGRTGFSEVGVPGLETSPGMGCLIDWLVHFPVCTHIAFDGNELDEPVLPLTSGC